jgi:putative transposase
VLRHPAQSNAVVLPGKCRRGRKSPGVIEGRQIQLGNLPQTFRLVTYRDELKDIVYQFLTNALGLPAKTVTDLYENAGRSNSSSSG